MLNGFIYLISGRPLFQMTSGFRKFEKDKTDEFDDFEEIN
jgi:hypothetical protein